MRGKILSILIKANGVVIEMDVNGKLKLFISNGRVFRNFLEKHNDMSVFNLVGRDVNLKEGAIFIKKYKVNNVDDEVVSKVLDIFKGKKNPSIKTPESRIIVKIDNKKYFVDDKQNLLKNIFDPDEFRYFDSNDDLWDYILDQGGDVA